MKTVGIASLGCRVNQYESGAISQELTALGFKVLPFNQKCDCYIVNTCAVTEESVRKSRQMVRRAVKTNPDSFVFVCGCASQLSKDDFLSIKGVKFVYGTRNKGVIVKAVKDLFEGQDVEADAVKDPEGKLDKTFISHFDRTRAYVKIQDGCNNKCAYCIIPKVRGRIVLRDKDEIVNEVKALASNGCHEVVLTGIETSAYGMNLGVLIKEISEIEGIDRIRMGSLDPSFVKSGFIDDIASVKQLCPHFHISVQNGSDDVLKAMRRRYNTQMLYDNISYIRSVIPNSKFSADIIVGFPGETDEDFKRTCEFVQKIGFLHLHIFTYSIRPGTEAAEMQGQVPDSIKNQRHKILSDIASEMKNSMLNEIINKGEKISVLVETLDGMTLTGHNDSFVECVIEAEDKLCKMDMRGSIIDATPIKAVKGKLICTI